ncbi:hypothetical protein N9R28_00705 [Flavobacteriaceae bacterium]|jgi:thymidylate kinase|nr:hypothetical protein [Flavobacteriaceae bacterium]
MENIMLSGPDGTGKSTISDAVIKSFSEKGIKFNHIWLRFNHYTAKIINLFGRISGKSFRVSYKWGKIGYHNYTGVFGVVYIFCVYIDHLIFNLIIKKNKIKKGKHYLIDRYLIDIVADLIVDTKNNDLVYNFFDKSLRKELKKSNAFILECDEEIVKSRRADINDDMVYKHKIKAYNEISLRYKIPKINTGLLSIEDATLQIINSCR